jgi:hypothetical protein
MRTVTENMISFANALENAPFSSPEEVVARIKATPPEPGSLRPASGSLADTLRNAPQDPDFDLETWNKAWGDIAAEMRATTHANNQPI